MLDAICKQTKQTNYFIKFSKTFIKLFKQIETLEEIELDDLTILKHVLEIVITMHNKKIAY